VPSGARRRRLLDRAAVTIVTPESSSARLRSRTMNRSRRLSSALLTLASATALAALAAAPAAPSPRAQAGADGPCATMDPSVRCGPGNGRQTVGGGDKVSHAGWPRITGVFAKVGDSTGRRLVGGPANDELLGHHGSDTIAGGAGQDVLWGDWDPSGNTTRQHDVLRGGAGDDFIYPSHGTTRVLAGPGNDHIWAFYGRGTIDCGPGRGDVARIRENGAFATRNCERIEHFCQYGSGADGSCLKPGEKRGRAARRLRGARA
jgi:RTX calcium-binding nonapeptide repeat (4 copies)